MLNFLLKANKTPCSSGVDIESLFVTSAYRAIQNLLNVVLKRDINKTLMRDQGKQHA